MKCDAADEDCEGKVRVAGCPDCGASFARCYAHGDNCLPMIVSSHRRVCPARLRTKLRSRATKIAQGAKRDAAREVGRVTPPARKGPPRHEPVAVPTPKLATIAPAQPSPPLPPLPAAAAEANHVHDYRLKSIREVAERRGLGYRAGLPTDWEHTCWEQTIYATPPFLVQRPARRPPVMITGDDFADISGPNCYIRTCGRAGWLSSRRGREDVRHCATHDPRRSEVAAVQQSPEGAPVTVVTPTSAFGLPVRSRSAGGIRGPRTEPRSRTVPAKRLTKVEREVGKILFAPEVDERPATRADCEDGERPCPWVSCKYNLYLDVDKRTGSMKLNFPHLEPDQLKASCVLDVAALDGATLEEVGSILNLTRERVRQVEVRGLVKLRARVDSDPARPHVLRDLHGVPSHDAEAAEDPDDDAGDQAALADELASDRGGSNGDRQH